MGNFTQPFLQQDLIGNENYPQQGRVRGFTFGRNTNVDNVKVDLWEGPTPTYVFPAVAQQMNISSTSALDTNGGTGLNRVYIHYLDANYAVQYEIVTLNGVTPVNTVATNILRINGLHAVTPAGALDGAAGAISLKGNTSGLTYGFISIGDNTARQAIYTVPAGLTGYISVWTSSSGSVGAHFCQSSLVATTHDGLLWPGVFLVQDEIGTQNGGDSHVFPSPIPIPAMADVKLRAISDGATANVTAIGAIMGWLETSIR